MGKKKPRSELQKVASERNWAKARLMGFRAGIFCDLGAMEKLHWKAIEEKLKELVDKWDINTEVILKDLKEKMNEKNNQSS